MESDVFSFLFSLFRDRERGFSLSNESEVLDGLNFGIEFMSLAGAGEESGRYIWKARFRTQKSELRAVKRN